MATTPMSNHPKSWPENRKGSGRGPTTAWTLPGGVGGRSLVEGTWEIAWKRNRFYSAGKQDFLFSIFTPFSPHTLLRVGCASCLFYSSAPRMHFHWTRPNPAQEQGVELGDRVHVKHSRLPSTKKKKKIKIWVSSEASLKASEVSASHITACP